MRRSATIVDAPIPDITAWNDEEFAQAYDRPAYFCVVAGIPHFRRGKPISSRGVLSEEVRTPTKKERDIPCSFLTGLDRNSVSRGDSHELALPAMQPQSDPSRTLEPK